MWVEFLIIIHNNYFASNKWAWDFRSKKIELKKDAGFNFFLANSNEKAARRILSVRNLSFKNPSVRIQIFQRAQGF